MKHKGVSRNFSMFKKFLYFLFIFEIFIKPTSPSELDYMYDLGDGVLDEGGFEFGDGFGQLTSETQNHIKNSNSSGILTFDINIDHKASQKTEIGSNSDGHMKEGSLNHGMKVTEGFKSDKFQSKLSFVGDYVFGTLLTIFGFLSLIGNSSILLVFCFRHRRLSPAEVFLVNLGVVDILLALASYPMSMVASFKHGWQFGEIGCTIYAFVCYFLGVASIFSVTAIALIRYLKTCTPVLGNQITCWSSCKMIAWGYVISLIWALMPLFGLGNYGPEPFGLSCTLDWVASDKGSKFYIMLVTVFCVFLPLFLIIFSYTQIILLVKQSDALVRSNGVNKRNTTSDSQLTWISGLVTLGFIIGWGPYTVVSLWASYSGEIMIPMWATPMPVLMAKSSIAYNPFIYIFFTARYRDDFKGMMHRWLHSHFKANEQNNNGNIQTRRVSSSRNHNKDLNNQDDADDTSPRNSATSSMTTRQFTTTTTTAMQITNNNMAEYHDDEIPLEQVGKVGKVCTSSHNNNNGHNFDEDEISNGEEDNYKDNEGSIILIRERNGMMMITTPRQSISNSNPASISHVVTMYTGNGVIVSSSSNSSKIASTARKIVVAASSSLFSLRNGISRCEEEQQV